jgi:NAD(P)-dependent dehydrogenase (short-subunit alcohol dehydrogenase family)
MKTVLITGASRGIGLEFAQQYAADGWRLVAACRAPEAATDLSSLAASNAAVSIIQMDVCDRASVAAAQASLDGLAIDLLINNAGVMGRRPQDFGDSDDASWLEVLDTNVIGPMRVVECLVANVEAGEGRMIATVSSRMGSIGANDAGGSYAYRSSKAGVNAVVKSLSVDLRARGITCVAFHPGWVRTDMGGASAPVTARECVAGMRRVIAGAGLGDSGGFFDYDGTPLPW